MPIPGLSERRSALLDELLKAGGVGKRKDIIEKLAQRFQLTPAEREKKDQYGERIVDVRVDTAAEDLRKKGLMEPPDKSGKGIWKLTESPGGITPLKVKSAVEATEIALSFINKHYQFIPQQPIKAVRKDDVWLVEVDVGLLRTRIAEIKIDGKTEAILEYTIPPEAV